MTVVRSDVPALLQPPKVPKTFSTNQKDQKGKGKGKGKIKGPL